jgi:hypothetical protein
MGMEWLLRDRAGDFIGSRAAESCGVVRNGERAASGGSR